ncbi:MAG TPA: DEAD/DEAH box helicase [Rhizobiaceae bacterium]|nr:DEAD/DEAH box helicase [Rhizobiaceae bacterium]
MNQKENFPVENEQVDAHSSGFAALGLSGALLKAVLQSGLSDPKPIQEQAIPPYLAGRDILGIAQTGSGKTAAFSLPILQKIVALGSKRSPKSARALILAPTRELAVQIEEMIRAVSKGLHISTALVLGGVSRGSQVKKLRLGVDILVATPGRLVDLVREGDVSLAETSYLVLDEADRMLDMGFLPDVRRLAKTTHPKRHTALFSATMPTEIAALAQSLMKDPVRIEITPQSTTANEIEQGVIMARKRQKRSVLAAMLADERMGQVIVFARTKHGADAVTRNLERDGFAAAVIHGNKSQNARQRALNGFREGSVRILVATDIAARGIDVPGISHVVNYDLPDEAESYVHRIGRTGRNGAEGIAVTLCDPSETDKLRQVERIIRMRLPLLASHLDEPDPEPQKSEPGERRAEPRETEAGRKQGGKSRGGHFRPQNPSRKPMRDATKDKPNRHQPPEAKGAEGTGKPSHRKFRGRRFGRKTAPKAA